MDDEKRWQDMNADEQAKRIIELENRIGALEAKIKVTGNAGNSERTFDRYWGNWITTSWHQNTPATVEVVARLLAVGFQCATLAPLVQRVPAPGLNVNRVASPLCQWPKRYPSDRANVGQTNSPSWLRHSMQLWYDWVGFSKHGE